MELTTILPHFTERHFKKGDFLLREGQVSQYVFFIQLGMVKVCSFHDDREFILRFFTENMFVTVFDSFTEQTPSHFQIKALEDGTALMLHRDKMEELCRSNHEIESFFRKWTQWVASQMVSRLGTMLENDAATRYKIFVENNSELMQRISLGDLASYLGITQASLSKIRAKK
jgi:CRP/FNR family transcriptional regulator, anaerobic regulatory protein